MTPTRRSSRSRSPSRRSSSTPKQSPRKSPTRRGRSPGRPRKQQQQSDNDDEEWKPYRRSPSPSKHGRGRPRIKQQKEGDEELKPSSPSKRGRPRKQEAEKTPDKTPAAPEQAVEQISHLTRSTITKTMVKEEKEALPDKDTLEKDLKKSRKVKSKEFEFGGPVGAFFMMVALPILVFDVYFYCNGKNSKCSFINNQLKLPHWTKLFDEGHLLYDGWLLFQFLLFFIPIGKVRMVNFCHVHPPPHYFGTSPF